MLQHLRHKQFYLFLALNCLAIIAVIAISFRKPQLLKVNKVEFVKLEDSFFHFRVNLAVKNPNFFSISGNDLALTLSESGKDYGTGTIDPVYLPRSGQSDITCNLSVNYKQLLRSYNSNTTDTLVPFTTITGAFMPGFFLHHVNLAKKISKRSLFSLLGAAGEGQHVIHADSFSLKKINALASQIDFTLKFTNNFNVDFSIEEIEATVYPSKNNAISLGTVSLKKSIALPQNETAAVPMQITVNNVSLVLALAKLGLKDLDAFDLKGEAVFAIQDEKIRVPFTIPLTKQVTGF